MIVGFGLIKRPKDAAKFEDHLWRVHIPLVKRMPGLRKSLVHRVVRSPGGQDLYMVIELHFDSMEAVSKAAASPEGAKVGEDRRLLLAEAETEMTIFWCETKET